MHRRIVTTAFAVLLAFGALPAAGADSSAEHCTDASRACVIETSMTYLDALVTNDASEVRLAPDVWRMNNGQMSVQGEQAMRNNIEQGERIVADIRYDSMRWFVEGEQAIVFYELEADATGYVDGGPFLPREARLLGHVAERFRVIDGLIHEIEVIFWGYPPGVEPDERPFRPADHGPGHLCGDQTRECSITAAQAYLDALVSGDGSDVPLAPDAWRLENGRNTGDGGEEIRSSLETPIMRVIREIEDIHWFVEDDQAIAFYVLWAEPTGILTDPLTPRELDTPAVIAERFRVDRGLIKEIEAVFWVHYPGAQLDERPSRPGPSEE